MKPPHLAAIAGAALLAAGLAGASALAQGSDQGSTNAIMPPSTQHQPGVLQPSPDVHGRAGAGTEQLHQNDAASPGGNAAAGTGTGAAGASTNQGTGANAGNAPLPLPPKGGSTGQ